MRGTTIASWAQLVARAVEARGMDVDGLFAEAGLDASVLDDPDARYSVEGMQRLWRLATDATGTPDFGLEAARCWHPSIWHALGYAWLASTTLRDAAGRVARYGRMVTTGVVLELAESQRGAWLNSKLRPGQQPAVRAAQDAAMATVVRMCRFSVGEKFRPLGVRFSYPRPASTDSLSEFFQAPLQFGSETMGLELARADLDQPLPTGNAELARANERVAVEYLARFDRSNLSLRVRSELLRQLPSGHASETSVAAALNIAPRTMQRRLRAERTTYSQLVEEVRRELAAQYVRQSNLSINEITYLLGFSEPSNFSRAFKRWTGRSPSAWRGPPPARRAAVND